MSHSTRRAVLCLTVSSLAVPGLGAHMALAGTTGPYLTWQGKTEAQPAQQAQFPVDVPSNPVPPSPYGQVGDPFVHTLNWPGKEARQTATPQAESPQVASVVMPPSQSQTPPAFVPPRVSQPVVVPRPQQVTVPMPQPSRQAPIQPEAAITTSPPPVQPKPQPSATDLPASQPAPQIAVPTPAPAPPKAAPQPAPSAVAQPDASYQVPSTSKYAARIAAARAADEPTPVIPEKTGTPPAPPQQQATAPEPAEPLAAEETDHVFIPGEHYTSAADEPRYYSLHRQYGIRPDPITVTPDATGAILDTSHIDAQEKADAQADADARSDGAGPDDSNSSGSSTDDTQTDN